MKSSNSKRPKKSQPFYLIVPFSYGTNLFTFKKKSSAKFIKSNLVISVRLRSVIKPE